MLRAIAVGVTLLLAFGAIAGAVLGEDKISRTDRAKIRKTRESMRSVHEDLRVYSQREAKYPATLKQLVDGKYREAIPKDGWERDFTYTPDEAAGFKLISWGADGKSGGDGADRDIVWTSQGEEIALSGDEAAKREALLARARNEGRVVLARARMAICGGEVVTYRRDKKAWPKTLAEVMRASTSSEDLAINACFTSPWGHTYALRVLPGDNFAIVCWGADGKEGGEAENSDFVTTEHEVKLLLAQLNQREWWGRSSTDWNIENLAQSIEIYRQRHGALPGDLTDLLKGPPNEAILRRLPRDRFDREYVYLVVGEDFHLIALGKDGREGGVDDDADSIWPVPGDVAEVVERGRIKKPDNTELLPEVAAEQLVEIADRINEHKTEAGAWPEKLEDVAGRFPQNTVPKDAWGGDFVYEPTKDAQGVITGYKLTTLGSDGAAAGEGAAADISIDQDGNITGK